MGADDQLSSYHYHLPEERIAQQPAERRDASRLLVLDRTSGTDTATDFRTLGEHLPAGALLVANNSRVLPARVFGRKPSGGGVEFLLLTPLPLVTGEPIEDGWTQARVEGLLRASKGPRPGQEVVFGEDLRLTVLERGEFGKSSVILQWRGPLEAILERLGHMPLPPYIKRPESEADRERYQTVYAREDKQGSVAAPTAGLHFTPELRAELRARFQWAEVTLYVGYGTFSPVRAEALDDHVMHQEFIDVPEDTAAAVALAKAEGRPVVAIGTTTARALEGMHAALGRIGPYQGMTDIFLRPGSTFHVVDHMLTNFHLPGSSLLIMVSALAGRERILAAYEKALAEGFRFFSYGDAMLIL